MHMTPRLHLRPLSCLACLGLLLTLDTGCTFGTGSEAEAGDSDSTTGDSDSDSASATDSDTEGDEGGDPDACTSFVVPQQIGFRWLKWNHRISTWDARLDAPAEGCLADSLSLDFVGGNFSTGETASDAPRMFYRYQPVADAPRARVAAARVSVEELMEADGVASGEIVIDRAEANIEGYAGAIALIEGFAFDTSVEQGPDYPDDYDPSHGYTTRGFGMSVEVTAIDESTVTVAYNLRFESGLSNDRPDLNGAMPFAQVGANLDILLLAHDGVEPQFGGVDYRLEYPEPMLGVDQEIEPAAVEDTRVTLQGEPGGPRGLIGLRSFDFALDPDPNCEGAAEDYCPAGETCEAGTCTTNNGEIGHYVRELTVGARFEDYDPESGTLNALLEGYADASSLLLAFYALRYDFNGELAWLQVEGGDEPVQVTECFDTGEHGFPLEPRDTCP